MQKTELIETLGPNLEALKELLLRCTTIEIVIVRDLLLKAFPNIFDSGPGINAALVNPPDVETPGHTAHIPPEDTMDTESDTSIDIEKAMSAESLTAVTSDRLPFSDDIEVHDIFREPRSDDVVATFINKLPEGVTYSTKDTAYVDFLMSTLFTKMYREDHCIPFKKSDFVESIIPPLPKTVIAFLHNVAIHHANDYKEEFDTETFWKMVRQNFAAPTYAAPAAKPTATDLLMQGRVVVATEDLLSKMRQTHDRDQYNKFVADLLEGQSPTSMAADPNVSAVPMDQSLNITRLNLRSRVVEATKESRAALERSGTRKRVMEETATTVTVKEVKKAKK